MRTGPLDSRQWKSLLSAVPQSGAVEARSADVVGDRFQAAEAGGIRAVDAGECQFGEAYASCGIVSLV